MPLLVRSGSSGEGVSVDWFSERSLSILLLWMELSGAVVLKSSEGVSESPTYFRKIIFLSAALATCPWGES